MGVIVIRSAARDADAGQRLAAALRRQGLDCRFEAHGNGPSADPASLKPDSPGTDPRGPDSPVPDLPVPDLPVTVALWSRASADLAHEDRGDVKALIETSLDALAAGRCVLATLDGTGDANHGLQGKGVPGHSLPFGFRDLPAIDLSRWARSGEDHADEGPLQDLSLACGALSGEDAPSVKGTSAAVAPAGHTDLWNALAVVTGGLFSLFAMAGIAASGLIGAHAGSRVWAEDLMAGGPEAWIPVLFALGAAVLFGIAGWFAAIGLFAGAGLLSVRPLGSDRPDPARRREDDLATRETTIRDVGVIHGPGDGREADILALDLHRLGLSVTPNPAQGSGDVRWTADSLRAVQGSNAIVLLGTAGTFRSERVFRELLAARRFGRPVLPLLLESVGVPGPLWSILQGRAWIRVEDTFAGLMTPELQRALMGLLEPAGPEDGIVLDGPEPGGRAQAVRPALSVAAATARPMRDVAREPALLMAAGQ